MKMLGLGTNETFRASRSVSEPHRPGPCNVERRTESVRSGIPKTGRCQPAKTRAETKSDQAAFRFPRPCRLEVGIGTYFSLLRDQFVIRQSLAGDFCAEEFKPLRIGHVLPRVVAEHLFVHIAVQVERLNRNIRALQSALQERPEVFHPVRVNLTIHVSLCMIDDLMSVFIKTVIRFQFVAVDGRSRFNVLADMCLNGWLTPIGNDRGADFSVTLKNGGHDGLTEVIQLALTVPLTRVHIPGLAADEGFIRLDFLARAADLSASGLVLHGEPNPMKHKPRGLLGDSQITGDLATANSVLTTGEKPDNRKPLIQAKRRILKDGSRLDAELSFRVPGLALPVPARRNKRSICSSACRARYDAIFPPATSQEVQAVVSVRKVLNCLDKGLREGIHNSILQE